MTLHDPGRIAADIAGKSRAQANGCILWFGALDRDGYPRLYVGRNDAGQAVQRNAARLAYEMTAGAPLGGDIMLVNDCGNRRCMSHLTAVPRAVAAARAAALSSRNRLPIVDGKYPCGHPATPENTNPDPRARRCRTCQMAYQTAYNRTRRGRRRRRIGSPDDLRPVPRRPRSR